MLVSKNKAKSNLVSFLVSTSFLTLALTVGFSNTSFADPVPQSKPTEAREQSAIQISAIQELIQKRLGNTKVGIVLQDLQSGKILYQLRGDEAFTPASCTKLLTAAAGLLYLGENYRYETSIKIPSSTSSGVSETEGLYLQFSGDPSLTSVELKELFKKVKEQGITRISGDLIIDNTRFQGLDYGLGWIWNSLWWYYSPPITTIMLNQNAVSIELQPTKNLGEKVVAKFLDEENKNRLRLTENVVSVTEEEANNHCLFMVNSNMNNDIDLSGCWYHKPEPTKLNLAIKNPELYAKQVITEALKEQGITLSGKIKSGVSTKNLTLKTIVTHQSKSLKEFLLPILQDSNNIYTESVTKTLGYVRFQEGTFVTGVKAMLEILKEKLKIDPSAMRLMDGSGLSRYNLITPNQFVALLYGMHQNPTLGKIFKEALPSEGEGTLKKRFQAQEDAKSDKEREGSKNNKTKIIAKTGSLMGVSTLSGYMTTEAGKEFAFSMMIDNALQDQKTLKQFEEELCELLLKF